MKPPKSHHRGIRVRPELDTAVEAERAAAGDAIDYTEALHRLALRGAAKEKKDYYFTTNVGRSSEIEQLWSFVDKAGRELTSVKSRLAGPLRPIPNDPERSANIEQWRKLTQELPAEFRHIRDLANGLSDILCGLTGEEIREIKEAGLQMAHWLPSRKKCLREAQERGDQAEIDAHATVVAGHERFIKITQRLLGSKYAESVTQ